MQGIWVFVCLDADAFSRLGCQVTELSDNPSTATNAKASSILSRLGVVPSDEIMTRSVKGVVNEILAFDGLQLSSEVMTTSVCFFGWYIVAYVCVNHLRLESSGIL